MNIKGKFIGGTIVVAAMIVIVGVLLSQLGNVSAANNPINIVAQPTVPPTPAQTSSSHNQIPAAIQVPAGNVLLFQATGKGVLMFACPASAASNEVPFIVVSSDNKKQIIGSHYAINGELIWEDLVGNSVVAVPQAKVPSPNANNAPWVLLKVQAHHGSGKGLLSKVTFIQRVNTSGGVAKPAACMDPNQAQESVPFTTSYLFYTA